MSYDLATRMDNFPRGIQNGNGSNWSGQGLPFGPTPMSGPPSWSNAPGKDHMNLFNLSALLTFLQASVGLITTMHLALSVVPIG